MLNQIYNNAINLLGEQLAGLFGNLFGNVGKRDLTSVLNANIGQVLASFVDKVKEIYLRLFKIFVQIVNHVEEWIEKPDWARIKFITAGADAETEVSQINIGVDFLQPLINLVQQHLQVLINDLEKIIVQVFNSIEKPIQTLIGVNNHKNGHK